MPSRVKVGGDLYHGHVPEGAIYVGRAAPGLPASPFANLFPVKKHGRAEAIRLYREYLMDSPELLAQARRDLAGKDLACWCKQDQLCHGDVLLEIANEDHS